MNRISTNVCQSCTIQTLYLWGQINFFWVIDLSKYYDRRGWSSFVVILIIHCIFRYQPLLSVDLLTDARDWVNDERAIGLFQPMKVDAPTVANSKSKALPSAPTLASQAPAGPTPVAGGPQKRSLVEPSKIGQWSAAPRYVYTNTSIVWRTE